VDELQAGVRQVATGEYVKTYTETYAGEGVSKVLELFGHDPLDQETKDKIGFVVDLGLGLVNPGGKIFQTAGKALRSTTRLGARVAGKTINTAGRLTGAGLRLAKLERPIADFVHGTLRASRFHDPLTRVGRWMNLKVCFVAGTPVYVPAESSPETADTYLAMGLADGDEAEVTAKSASGDGTAIWAATAAALAGVAALAAGETYVNRRRKNEQKEYELAADEVFGSLAFE
jgi:hypothetical protein